MTAVESAVKRHPKSVDYRVGAQGKQILVYERDGPSVEEMTDIFSSALPWVPDLADRVREFVYRRPRYSPVLRFTLLPEQPATASGPRTFGVERWRYRGSVDGWLELYQSGPIAELAERIIPKLGTNAYYELY